MQRLLQLPFFVILMGIGALSMYVPAMHGFAERNYVAARAFFYTGTFFFLMAVLVGIATAANAPSRGPRNQLLTLLGAYTLLPVLFAVPFREAVLDTTFYNAWWEMVSSFTTTGASLYEPGRLPPTLHLWRALVGWMGLALFGAATVVVVARLFMRRGALLLDADGFTDTTSASGVGFVSWSEVMVTTTRTVGRTTLVGVELSDPVGFVEKLPALKRAAAQTNLETFGTPVWIVPTGLAEPDVLAALIYEYRAGWVGARRWEPAPEPE